MLAKNPLLLLSANLFVVFQPPIFLYSNLACALAVFFFYQLYFWLSHFCVLSNVSPRRGLEECLF